MLRIIKTALLTKDMRIAQNRTLSHQIQHVNTERSCMLTIEPSGRKKQTDGKDSSLLLCLVKGSVTIRNSSFLQTNCTQYRKAVRVCRKHFRKLESNTQPMNSELLTVQHNLNSEHKENYTGCAGDQAGRSTEQTE